MKKYNWELIRISFVKGKANNKGKVEFLTLKALASYYSISYMYLRQRAAKEGWIRKREIYRKKLELAIQRESTKVLVSKVARFDLKALEVAQAGISQIKIYFLDHVKKMREAKEEGVKIPLFDYKILDALSKALVSFQRAGKIALEKELPPVKYKNKALKDFLKKEAALTPEQREKFLIIALEYEKELNKEKENKEKKKEYKA